MDTDRMVVDSVEGRVQTVHNFIVAVDFGTTFSSVAYLGYSHPNKRNRAGHLQVRIVKKYPYSPRYSHDVPTELWYFTPPPDRSATPSDVINIDDDESSDSLLDRSSDASSDAGPDVDLAPSDPLNKNRDTPSTIWGYEIQNHLKEQSGIADPLRRLARFKLMLDNSPHTASVRSNLEDICNDLKKFGVIYEDTDIIADYLTQLFIHTKNQLEQTASYTEASAVEFVLCIPAVWKAKAFRQMQRALVIAVAKSGLGQLQNGSVDNLFFVSEPEAAATCLIETENEHLTIDETFLLLDAGGGTIDAITYSVSQHEPLRLKVEEVMPGGALCGSSFINGRYEKLLIDKLKHENYLEQGDRTIAKIIDGLVVEFETEGKRNMDHKLNSTAETSTVFIRGLRKNKKRKGLEAGKLILSRQEMKSLFQPSVDGVAEVMLDQLKQAYEKGREVKKVILMGGFGQSEYLSSVLAIALEKAYPSQQIRLISSSLQSDAVARGAVLRAINKEDGPHRKIQSSYGFLRTEPYMEHDAHENQEPKTDPTDGLDYINDTVDWVIQKGTELRPNATITKQVEYTFALRKTKFLCTETLVVSDDFHESHYKLDHPKNSGAEIAGQIQFDLTFLKDEKLIKALPSPVGKMTYWKVTATLVITVDGRNLRYEVRWPGEDGQLQGVGQTCIAAAFIPGTE